jgi:hypothetical protein
MVGLEGADAAVVADVIGPSSQLKEPFAEAMVSRVKPQGPAIGIPGSAHASWEE